MILITTPQNIFSEYFYGTLFGQIRIEKNVIYLHSVYNKEKGNGYFQKFMNFVTKSKKDIIMLDVRNEFLYNHFKNEGFHQHKEVTIKGITFNNCLIKHPIT